MGVIDPSNLVDKLIEFMAKFLIDIPGQIISTSLDSGIAFSLWEDFFGKTAVIQGMFIIALSIGIFTAYTKHDVLRGGHKGGSKM